MPPGTVQLPGEASATPSKGRSSANRRRSQARRRIGRRQSPQHHLRCGGSGCYAASVSRDIPAHSPTSGPCPVAARGDVPLGYTCHVEFARHRSVACIIGIGVTLGGCGGTRGAVMRRAPVERRTTTVRAEEVGSGPCRISRVAASEPGGQLVPGTPRAMTLCRHAGLPYRRGQKLLGFTYIDRESVIERLTRELNALPPVPDGTFACPSDDRAELAVVLRYAHERPLLIEIQLGGCPVADRGAITRWGLGPPGERLFISDLERLIPCASVDKRRC